MNNCAFKCPSGQVWYDATQDINHNGVFTCDINQSEDWLHDVIEDGASFVCTVFETACGNVDSTFTLEDGVTADCIEVNDVGTCVFSCPNDLLSYPLPGVTCNSQTGQWNELAATISCKETRCGDTDDFNYGSDWSDVEASCDYSHIDDRSTCNLECSSGFPFPVSVVVCNSAQETVPSQDGTADIFCADTPCGNLDDFFNVNADGLQQSCDENGCELSCSNGNQMPSVRNVVCQGTQFQFADGVDGSTPIECIAKQDTPCGNLDEAFDFDNSILVQCDEFNSVTQNAAVSCSLLCDPTKADADDIVVGGNQIVCENGSYNRSPDNTEQFFCAATQCGDPEDSFEIVNATSAAFDCNGNVCSVVCSDASMPTPNVPNVVCNPLTNNFRDVTLFPGTDFPVVNPDIECQDRQGTVCGNPEDSVPHNATTISFDCDYDSGKCQVQCASGQANSYATVEEVVCNAQTENFLTVDESIDCLQYDSQCGDIDDHFDLDDQIQFTCIKENIFDVCKMSCPGDLIPSPTDEIRCNRLSFIYLNAGITVECVEPPETECGYLSDNFDIDDDVTANCDPSTGVCEFTCPLVTDYIEVKSTQCINGKYTSKGATVECLVKDTACGDFIHPHTSSKNCADNSCAFTCADGYVYGIANAACEDGAWTYEYNLPSAVESAEFSNCLDTMCGTLTGDIINIDESVTVDTSDLEANMGFGAIALTCSEEGQVISGLNGESAVGCNANTGLFDVANQGATVSCADTVCGNPEDVIEISDNTNTECSDSGCQFTCDEENVRPSLDALVCDVATSNFLVGSVTRVSCNANCPPFGPDSGFMLDNKLRVKCSPQEDNPSLDTCDLICMNRPAKPQVKETEENLNQVKCVYDEDTGEAQWQHVIHNVFGVPTTKEIQSVGNRTEVALRNILCDVEAKPTPPPKETQCGGVRDEHEIDDEVKVRCSWEICSLECPKGKEVNTELDWLYCVKNFEKLDPFWFPKVDHTIKCVNEGGSKGEENKAKVCENPRNNMEMGVKKSCSGGNGKPSRCEFTCKVGSPNVPSMTCSLDGEWNVHESVDIVCNGGSTTEAPTTSTTEATTSTTEQIPPEPSTTSTQPPETSAAGIVADGGNKKKKNKGGECTCQNTDACGKKELKKKNCDDETEEENNNNGDGNGEEATCVCTNMENTKCDKKQIKHCKSLLKQQKKEEKEKNKKNKKEKEGKKKKDKGNKEEGKKKKKKKGGDDTENVETTMPPKTSSKPMTKRPGKDKGNKDGGKGKNKNKKELEAAASIGDEAALCDPIELSKQFGAGLDIDCDFGFKENGQRK